MNIIQCRVPQEKERCMLAVANRVAESCMTMQWQYLKRISQKFTYTRINMPLRTLGKAQMIMSWLWKNLIDDIWVNWRNTCGCILRHTSETLLPYVTSRENQKKSAKISGRELFPSLVWFILGYSFQMLEGATFMCSKQLYAGIIHHGNVHPLRK